MINKFKILNLKNLKNCNNNIEKNVKMWYSVDNSTSCTTYKESQSATGVKTGCMKFYAFNDDGGNTSGCSYRWLYDRTSTNCTTYGCLNNSDAGTYGYWTVSPYAAYSYDAWRVGLDGTLYNFDVGNDSNGGVRPVITVLKSKLN